MAREPGTFYMLDKPETDELLKRLPAKEGVLLYLLLKRSFRLKGATNDELIKALGCALKTLDTALRTLKKENEIVQKGERFFRTDSSSSAPDVASSSGPDSRKSPPENPVQDSLFEEYEVRGRTLKSLSRAEDEKNQKLELLHIAFQHYPEILTEVKGRREKWLELPLGTIADAIERITGRERFVTDLKNELDALANVKAPQSAKRSAAALRAAALPLPKPRPAPRQEAPKSVPGEKSAAEVLAEQERVRLEDEAAPFEFSESGKRFLERFLGADKDDGGHFPSGISPPERGYSGQHAAG